MEIHDVVYQVGQGCPITAKLEFSVENSSRVLQMHDVVYQVGQGCPINAKLEFSVENSSRWCKYTTCLSSRTRMSDYSKTRIFGRKF